MKVNATAQVKDLRLTFKPYFDELGQQSFDGPTSHASQRRSLSEREYMLSGKRSAVQANGTLKLAFVNDIHLELNYTAKKEAWYNQHQKDLTLTKALNNLSAEGKKYM